MPAQSLLHGCRERADGASGAALRGEEQALMVQGRCNHEGLGGQLRVGETPLVGLVAEQEVVFAGLLVDRVMDRASEQD